MDRILVTGAGGQFGSELIEKLQSRYGFENVIASDIFEEEEWGSGGRNRGHYERVDVLSLKQLNKAVEKYNISVVYHLAALLSAKAEQNISQAWRLNIEGLLNVLKVVKNQGLRKLFWPSSIAVFGSDVPFENTPQNSPLNPTTIYGISKVAGEKWCAYFHRKFGVDVRSLRYPGLIGHRSLPGGGTTDYAVQIFYNALRYQAYSCYLTPTTRLPMMYMEDAIQAAIQLMETNEERITVRTSYNVSAISFSPKEIADSLLKRFPHFRIKYQPDYRQEIADSWPNSIDDSVARNDWDWKHRYDLEKLTEEMLHKLSRVQIEGLDE